MNLGLKLWDLLCDLHAPSSGDINSMNMSCCCLSLSLLYCLVCSLQHCDHLLGKGLSLGNLIFTKVGQNSIRPHLLIVIDTLKVASL